jgi:hypothetical protein
MHAYPRVAFACRGVSTTCAARRYPQDTVHDVATKELEYVQGYGDSIDEAAAALMPSAGYTPGDGFMSPESRAILRNADGSATDSGAGNGSSRSSS